MESTWLKSVFEETSQPKRIKFSDLSAELHMHFPERKYSVYEVSQLVHEAFPHTESKRCGKSRQTQILGLKRIHDAGSLNLDQSQSGVDLEQSFTLSQLGGMEQSFSTLQPGTEIADGDPLRPSYSDLLIENQQLKERIQELERFSATSLCSQADAVIHHASTVKHGPNSLDHFHEIELASIINELQSQAPDLYHLYMMLGDTKRNQEREEVTTEEVKAVASMCSLLNARSANCSYL